MATKGIRLNNPGNIELGDKWQGLADKQLDTRFCTFSSPVYGMRAIAKLMLAYQRKYGLNTVRKLIGRWAPPFENFTDQYAENVARWGRIDADSVIDVKARDVLGMLIRGIVRQENGSMPYSDEQVEEAINLALEG